MDENVIFKVLMGSHLYGTNGPDSDQDYKALYLPNLNHMLLGKQCRNRQERFLGTETEYVPLQTYFDHFFVGQTYAIEMAFVLRGKFKHYSWISALLDKFLTRDVEKMMGYAVAQARVYGLKAERAVQLQKAYDTIVGASIADPTILMMKMEDCGPLDDLKKLQFIKQIQIPASETVMVPALDILGKKFPYSATWGVVTNSLQRSLNLYGQRAKSYSETKADLKAMSHAIRIIDQIIELCATGWITFPRPNAEFLKRVKYGQMPVEEARDHLQQLFERVEDIVDESRLPAKTPKLEAAYEDFKITVLRDYYGC